MFQELFVGLVPARGGAYGVCACIDGSGVEAGFCRFPWSPAGLARVLSQVQREARDVVVGVEGGGWEPDLAHVLVSSSRARVLHPAAVETLTVRVQRKRNALRARATSLALLLLATDFPAKPACVELLAAPVLGSCPTDWKVPAQQRLLARLG